MKTITIRDIPDGVYDALKESAQQNRRSLQQQVHHLLMHDVQLRQRSVCEQAATYRAKLAGRAVAQDVVQDLRER